MVRPEPSTRTDSPPWRSREDHRTRWKSRAACMQPVCSEFWAALVIMCSARAAGGNAPSGATSPTSMPEEPGFSAFDLLDYSHVRCSTGGARKPPAPAVRGARAAEPPSERGLGDWESVARSRTLPEVPSCPSYRCSAKTTSASTDAPQKPKSRAHPTQAIPRPSSQPLPIADP
jgi:hypothetical protein